MIQRDSDLLKNILLFSQALRDKKVGVTTDNVIDALKGISFIDIQNRKDFYHLLKSNFVSSKDELGPFDELFERFWSFDDQLGPTIKKGEEEGEESSEEKEESLPFGNKASPPLIKEESDEREKQRQEEQKELLAYSPEEVLGRKDFAHLEKEELKKVKALVLSLSRKMAMETIKTLEEGEKRRSAGFTKIHPAIDQVWRRDDRAEDEAAEAKTLSAPLCL